MRILPVQVFDVQAHAAPRCERLKELLEEFRIHLADLVAYKVHFPDEIGTVAKVDCRAAQRLIHWQIGMTKACDPAEITKCFDKGFSHNNAGILARVMHIDVEIALCADMKIYC